MGKNTLKRGLIIGIICMFFLTTCIPVLANEEKPDLVLISFANATHHASQELMTNDALINKSTINNEDLPDLIITDISIQPGSLIGTQECYCTIKNIGNSSTGYEIEVKIIVKRNPLGIFPGLFTIFSDSSIHCIDGGLKPGVSIDLYLVSDDNLPKFGFYRFYCTVNPKSTIKEISYENNDYNEKHFVFFNIWF